MKKIILLCSAFSVLGSYAANAHVDLNVNLGEPAYYAPPPVYVAPPAYAPGYVEYYHRYPSQYYDHRRHHHHDEWAYWAHNGEGRRDHR